jgi:hypothetical protein
MSVSMYTVSIRVFIQHLNGLNTVLDKAATWAAARKVNETDLLNMRLSPDMFNLARHGTGEGGRAYKIFILLPFQRVTISRNCSRFRRLLGLAA